MRVCQRCLAEPTVREVFNSHLQENLSQIAKEAGEFEAVWSCARCQSWWQFRYLVLNTGSEGCHRAEEVLSVHVGLWNS